MHLNCPECGQAGISFLNKLFVSSRLPAICRFCERKFAVSGVLALMSLIPLFVGVMVSAYMRNPVYGGIACALGLAAYLFVFMTKVPLVKKA